MKRPTIRLKHIIPALAVLTAGVRDVSAEQPVDRLLEYSLPYNYCADMPLSDPALTFYSHTMQLSSLEAGWSGDRLIRKGFFRASTFMPIRSINAAVWGKAAYDNGYRRSDGIIESADYNIVYPYAIADTVGGRMKIENYSFSGGYSHRGTLIDWGASMAYNAALSYRNRDPRPRNVSGTLDARAGIGCHIGPTYVIAASAAYRKYKQSSSIMFMSELGEPVVYHLIGLGMTYNRFNSQGKNTHYSGDRYSLTVDLLPGNDAGFIGVAEVSEMSLDYVLKDLNSLPLSHIRHQTARFEAGYRSRPSGDCFTASAYVGLWRRRGTENIFGDASANVYPLIASLDMFNASGSTIGVKTAGIKRINKFTLSMTAHGGHTYRNFRYLSPSRSLGYKAWLLDIAPSVFYKARQSVLSLELSYDMQRIADKSILGFRAVSDAIVRDCLDRFDDISHNINTFGARLRYDHEVTATVALGLSLSATHNEAGNSLEAKFTVSL